VKRERVLASVVLLVVLCACAARFVHLDRHFYFHDEATTSLYLSGYTWHDFERDVSSKTSKVADVRRYQEVGSSGGVLTEVHHLAQGDPQHPPLFFVAAHFWAAVFGSSITSFRALAALFGVLTLPCVFWFGRELFGSPGPAWISVGLTAISPFQVLYSQEAREYSLWAATTALASAALLFALRRSTRAAWALYALCVVLALYTFPLSLLVLACHAVYVGIGSRQSLKPFAVAAALALLACVPWALAATRSRSAFRAGTDWTTESISFVTLMKSWLVVLAGNVVDKRGDTGLTASVTVLLAAVVAAQVVALVFLWLRGPRRAALYVTLLVAGSFLSLALADLATGGVRSAVPRFLVPTYLGLTLAFGYLIFRGLQSKDVFLRIGSVAVAAGAIACAVGSYAHEASARVWWNQDDGAAAESRAVVDVLNRRDGAFLIATGAGALLELTNYLRPETRIRLVLNGVPPQIPPGTRHVFAYGSPATPVAAERLRRLLSGLRARGAGVDAVHVELPCCGAGIAAEANQFWRVTAQRTTGR
jgi:uncharacterized membrane protein